MHILRRLTMTTEDVTASKLDVFSAKRDGDRWLGLLSGDFEITAAALQRALGSSGPRTAPSPEPRSSP